MSEYLKLLIIEDEQGSIDTFNRALVQYNRSKKTDIKAYIEKDFLSSLKLNIREYDGVVVDIKIKNIESIRLKISESGLIGFIDKKSSFEYLLKSVDPQFIIDKKKSSMTLCIKQGTEEKVIDLDECPSDSYTIKGDCVEIDIDSDCFVSVREELKKIAGDFICKYFFEKYRIPVVILTGTPMATNVHIMGVKIFDKAKGDESINEILDIFTNFSSIGITRIMGGRGAVDEALNNIFWENILPNLDVWEKYHSDAEKPLLRYIINHLMMLVDDSSNYVPEEMYILSDASNNLEKTGSVLKDKTSSKYYINLSPACDIAQKQSEYVLLVELVNDRIIKEKQSEKKSEDNKKSSLFNFIKNNKGRYHFFPKSQIKTKNLLVLEHMEADFQRISNVQISDLNNEKYTYILSVAPLFLKDIIARFSLYYARQGSPDFAQVHINDIVDKILK